MRIRICHLYGNLLNTYGDQGNVLMLAHEARILGMPVETELISINSNFDPDRYNLVFIGGGQDHEQRVIAGDLPTKKTALKRYIEDNGTLLAICGGYQLLGHFYETHLGERIEGVGLLPHHTLCPSPHRLVGDVVIQTPDPGVSYKGFENHAGRTYLGTGEKPLGRVLQGYGNNGEDRTEGAIYENVYCSYFHGPLLVRNRHLARHLVQLAAQKTIQP